jgi:hypothetical protein
MMLFQDMVEHYNLLNPMVIRYLCMTVNNLAVINMHHIGIPK